MTDATVGTTAAPAKSGARDIGIRRRRASETRFKIYGIAAIAFAVLMLGILLTSIFQKGARGFFVTVINAEFFYDPAVIDPDGQLAGASPEQTADIVKRARTSKYRPLVSDAVYRAAGVDPSDRDATKVITPLISKRMAVRMRENVQADPSLVGQRVETPILAHAYVTAYLTGVMSRDTPEDRRDLSDASLDAIDRLVEEGVIERRFNWGLFTDTASTSAEATGLAVALIGSAYMMLIVLVVALPIGVAASIYLEEFAPKNRLTDLIEVNINNLAAVPSIVFGLLGLAVFINFAGLPRSTPIVGGLVLSLMTLPTIIIATRAALKAVPPSIRQAALGVGASKTQSVFHHVLPLALPGILTGTIIGLAQALGETAPLLMVGLSAFVDKVPTTPFEPATALPSAIYSMSTEGEVDLFIPLTSASIMVLLVFLAIMNLTAVYLRKRFERKW